MRRAVFIKHLNLWTNVSVDLLLVLCWFVDGVVYRYLFDYVWLILWWWVWMMWLLLADIHWYCLCDLCDTYDIFVNLTLSFLIFIYPIYHINLNFNLNPNIFSRTLILPCLLLLNNLLTNILDNFLCLFKLTTYFLLLFLILFI